MPIGTGVSLWRCLAQRQVDSQTHAKSHNIYGLITTAELTRNNYVHIQDFSGEGLISWMSWGGRAPCVQLLMLPCHNGVHAWCSC